MSPKLNRPNFLIFITDQWHPRCFGYAGHPVVRTPNIDALAASGINFSRAYSPQPLCMPARATLFTGLTPRGHGVRMNGIPLDPAIPTFTEALRQSGYHTHCCGKIHLQCSQPPHGKTVDDIDPLLNAECAEAWRTGKFTELPLPFYGLESVDYANGHGDGSFGQYLHWLKREHPNEAHLFFDKVSTEPKGPGFDLFNRKLYKWALPAALHPTHWIADRTIDYLDARDGEQPFCVMCSIQDPHSPFAAPTPYCDHYDPADVPPPIGRDGELDDLPPHFRAMVETNITTSGNKGEAMNRTDPYYAECAAQYYGLIDLIDDQVGRVMNALRNNGLEENTIVLFIADHGEALGDHGLWGKGPYHIDGVIRVPMLASWPGQFLQGYEHAGPVGLLDFAPTILDLAGVEALNHASPETRNAPSAMSGRSLVPIMRGEDTDTDSDAIVEMDEDYLGFKMRTLVTKRHRLTCYSGQPYGELFDLENDPDELYNLWNDPASAAVKDQLRVRLLDRLMQTDISVPRQTSRS